jgi:hypothetical protein
MAAMAARAVHVFFRRTGLVTFLVPVVLAAAVVFLVAFLAVEAAFLPVSTGFGGNHTNLVALAFATNEAPRAAHFSLSVTLFHGLLISIISCSLPLLSFTHFRPDPEVDLGVIGLWVTNSPVPKGRRVTPRSVTSRQSAQSQPWSSPAPSVSGGSPARSSAIRSLMSMSEQVPIEVRSLSR